MKVVEQMLSRYAREEDHHALRGKQGHSLIFHLRGAPWAPWSTTERELGTVPIFPPYFPKEYRVAGVRLCALAEGSAQPRSVGACRLFRTP